MGSGFGRDVERTIKLDLNGRFARLGRGFLGRVLEEESPPLSA